MGACFHALQLGVEKAKSNAALCAIKAAVADKGEKIDRKFAKSGLDCRK